MIYRKDIQILRGISVILVVLFHLEIGGFYSGFLGVDVFLVISGFLMAVLYRSDQMSSFLYRRAKRLLPAYFVTLIFTIVATAIITTPVEFNSVENQSLFALSFLSNVGYWLENSYFSKAEFKPLLHLWSLGIEIQFYIIVPLLYWLYKRTHYSIYLIGFISLLLCFLLLAISAKTSFFLLPFRLWEFLIGFIVASVMTNQGNLIFKTGSRWIGGFGLVWLLLIPLIAIDGQSTSVVSGHPGLFALFVCTMTAFVLAFGLPKIIENSFFGSFFETMGKYSYSIYLTHFPIIVLFLYQPLSGTILKTDSIVDLVAIISLILLASLIMFHFVERLEYFRKKKILLLGLPGVILLCIYAGKTIQSKLYTSEELTIFNAWTDRATYRCGKAVRITSPLSLSCKLNDETFDESVFLVGNSHADSIKVAFTEVATRYNKNTLFFVSNKPLMNSKLSPEVVVTEAAKRGANNIVLHYSPDAIEYDVISELVDLAFEKNIKVDFLKPVPVWDIHVPKALYENITLNNKLPKQNIRDYNFSNTEFDVFLSELSRNTKNFRVFEVADNLCSPDCKLTSISGEPLYFDNDHLTLTGSNLLKPSFEKIFE